MSSESVHRDRGVDGENDRAMPEDARYHSYGETALDHDRRGGVAEIVWLVIGQARARDSAVQN